MTTRAARVALALSLGPALAETPPPPDDLSKAYDAALSGPATPPPTAAQSRCLASRT